MVMLYEPDEKRYYRFPSKNNYVDLVEYGPAYFPGKSLAEKDEKDYTYSSDTTTMKGEL